MNPPTSATLAPGATRTYGVKFLLADEIRNIEATLTRNDRPVAIGIPGYVLPVDIEGRLFIKHKQKVARFAVEPAGALDVKRDSQQHFACAARRGDARVSLSLTTTALPSQSATTSLNRQLRPSRISEIFSSRDNGLMILAIRFIAALL